VWRWAWPAWVVSTAVSFSVLELAAFRYCKHETLSRCLARWLGVHPRARHAHLGMAAFLSAWFWLTIHIYRIKEKVPR
jgi:hypothetical protein